MGLFDGKVAIVTGAGRGIGRSHALLLASEGAAVVVNDLGGSSGGEGADATPAQQVVDEIEARGGRAITNYVRRGGKLEDSDYARHAEVASPAIIGCTSPDLRITIDWDGKGERTINDALAAWAGQ